MKNYYSIANFVMGEMIRMYNYWFPSYYEDTYDNFFGQFTVAVKGSVGTQFMQGILPEYLVNNWGRNLTQTIATEWLHYVQYLEFSDKWNGDAFPLADTPLWKFVNEWSTVTTIAAGVMDVIPQLISQSTFDGISVLTLASAVGVDFTKLAGWQIGELVEQFGLESLEQLKALGVDFSKFSGWPLVKKFGLESLEQLKEAGVDFSKFSGWPLVKKFGLESLEQLKEAGADFTKLAGWQIGELVEQFGLESLEQLKALGVDFSKFSGWPLVKKFGLESLEPLKALGVDFTKLEDWHITELAKKFGLEILEQLKDPGVLNTMENQELIQHFQPSSSMDANAKPYMDNYGNEQYELNSFNPPDLGDDMI